MSAIVDIVSAFREVSTRSDQAHSRDALTAAEAVSAGLPNLGRLMCDGGLSRLTERYTAATIAAAAPAMLATLTNRVCMAADIDEVWSRDRVRR